MEGPIIATRVFLVSLMFILVIGAEKSRNLHSADRSADQCPQPDFLPHAQAKKNCTFSNHCSRVECSTSGDGHKLTISLKIDGCLEPPTVTVGVQELENHVDWAHTFQDGEKAAIPTASTSFTGALPVSEASLFVQVWLKRINGSILHYRVAVVGEVVSQDMADPVNVTLLTGESPTSTKNCAEDVVSDAVDHDSSYNYTPMQGLPINNSYGQQGMCPRVHLNDGTECAVSNHCSKVTCTSPRAQMVLNLQINGCSEPVTVSVTATVETSLGPTSWSHTFQDGDMASLPTSPEDANQKKSFLKAELKENSLLPWRERTRVSYSWTDNCPFQNVNTVPVIRGSANSQAMSKLW